MSIHFQNYKFFLFMALGFLTSGCHTDASSDVSDSTSVAVTTQTKNIPDFNAANSYGYIQKQVDFGPRVPGTPAQKACSDWMEVTLKGFCDTVYRQDVKVTAGNGQSLPCINLIGAIRPDATNRVLLLAHWDSRPWADQDAENKDKPILGADDGASGVGVLLEIAQIVKNNPLPEGWGIDILFTDVEDYGKSEWGDNSYALGTQYWAKHPHVSGYKANAGILLDMVGARNARFPLEGYSAQHAPSVQKDVWDAASQAGFSSYFVFSTGGTITDDHVPVNEVLHIPTIDIINLPSNSRTGFGNHWHTHLDDMSIIDQNTLKAVGQTLLQYLYTR